MMLVTLLAFSALASGANSLDQAVIRYNGLEGVSQAVVVGPTSGNAQPKAFVIPAWTKDVVLDPAEAASIVSLAEFGLLQPDRRRKWTLPEYIAGGVLEGASQQGKPSGRSLGMDPNRGEPPAIADRVAPAIGRYQRRLGQLGSCTGALASAIAKLSAARPADEFTQFTLSVRRRLGATMLPPDTKCLTSHS